jgi:hypothetical protein
MYYIQFVCLSYGEVFCVRWSDRLTPEWIREQPIIRQN